MHSIGLKKLVNITRREAPCLKVSSKNGEKALRLANKLALTERKLTIEKDHTNSLCIPLNREPKENELFFLKSEIPELKMTTRTFSEKNKHPQTLAEILKNELPPHLLEVLPRALDIVGDIAIIEIPLKLETHKHVIGSAILKTYKNIKTVLAKAGPINGTYRLRKFEFIAGEQKTETLHKEYGCSYFVDVAKAYFSPRLSHEHNRVASLVQKGEIVVDLFAGVGPFAVLIAKKHPDSKVYSVDINFDAIALLEKNARLNRVENRVYPLVGDAHQVVNDKLGGIADRVIMNLPETATEFIDAACKALRLTGGIVHFYGFTRFHEGIVDLKNQFSDAVEKAGRKVELFSYAKSVRETAPHECQVVLDAKIR